MSSTVPYRPAGLYRLAAVAGLVAAGLLTVAVARRGGVLPENGLTHALAPPSAALALFALTGFYLWQRERAGTTGLVGYALNLLGMAGLFAVEFVTHAVFQFLTDAEVDGLLEGPTRGYFQVVAFTFLAGVVVFAVASLRAGVLPAGAVGLYLLGFAPASLRGAVPEAVYLGGLLVGAAGVAWMSVAILRAAADRPTPATVTR